MSVMPLFVSGGRARAWESVAPPDDFDYFVSPTGSGGGSGSELSPWSMTQLLAMPAALTGGGKRVGVKGGYYGPSTWVNHLLGTAANPIIVQNYPGEIARIDCGTAKFALDAFGGYVQFRGIQGWFDFFSSDTDRISAEPGSNPTDCARGAMSVTCGKPGIKLIGCIIRDLGDGIFANLNATDLEIYFCLIFNNGWMAPDRSHGHGLYLQNQTGTKLIKHNIVFSSAFHLAQVYGSDAAFVKNFDFEENTFFCAGEGLALGDPGTVMMEGSSAGNLGFSTWNGNNFMHPAGINEVLHFQVTGKSFPIEDITFTNNRLGGLWKANEGRNYVVTGNKFTTLGIPLTGGAIMTAIRVFSTDTYPQFSGNWNNNAYHTPSVGATQDPFYTVKNGVATVRTFPSWKTETGFDAASTMSTTNPVANEALVYPHAYDPKRAQITVWNWQGLATQALDLSSICGIGDSYRIRHAYDYDGVRGLTSYSGTYSGPVTVGLIDWTAPQPVGTNFTPLSCADKLNSFIAEKTN